MKKQIQALGRNVVNNKGTWIMAIINVLASGLIVTGGMDISKNTTAIDQSKSTNVAIHKRITEQQVEIAGLKAQVTWLKDALDNLTRRIDRFSRK